MFSDIKQIEKYRCKVLENINNSVDLLDKNRKAISNLEFFQQIKFNKSYKDTLFEDPTNFIEQINQTATYLVCLSAVNLLLTKHPSHSFKVNFGTKQGYDITSEDSSIICECFAVTAPDSNGKLKKDTERVACNRYAIAKYVVFYSAIPKHTHITNIRKKYPDVEIIQLDSIVKDNFYSD